MDCTYPKYCVPKDRRGDPRRQRKSAGITKPCSAITCIGVRGSAAKVDTGLSRLRYLEQCSFVVDGTDVADRGAAPGGVVPVDIRLDAGAQLIMLAKT
jgi:hypothetical protein